MALMTTRRGARFLLFGVAFAAQWALVGCGEAQAWTQLRTRRSPPPTPR